MSDSSIRRLAWFAMVAQPVFVAAWVIAGLSQPRYSHIDQSISELGARFAEHPWIVNGGFVVLGLSVAALAPGLLRALPARPSARVSATLFAFTGAGLAILAALPLDCSFTLDATCEQRLDAGQLSWQTEAHLWLGLILAVTIVATPFVLARALRARPVAPFLLAAGAYGVILAVAATALDFSDAEGAGVIDRVVLGTFQVWVILVAAGILDAARGEPDSGALSNVPARDFFGREWTGEGEIVYRPAFLWRIVRQRFRVHRTTTWLSEGVWLVEDRATFDDARVYEQRRLCELETPDKLRVTAGDLPDGAVFDLTEEGYRLEPYTLLAPLGPVGVLLRCRDRHQMNGSGELIDTIDVRCLGLPVARIEVRARLRAAPGGRSAEARG